MERAAVHKHASQKWLLFILAIILLLALWVWTTSPIGQEVKAVVEGQLAALRSNRITEAYYAYTSHDYQNETPLSAFKELVSAYDLLGGSDNIHFDESIISGEIAWLKGAITTYDNEKHPIEYALVKEDDDWKILSMEMSNTSSVGAQNEDKATIEVLSPIDALLRSLRENNIESAYNNNTSKDFKKATTLENFKKFVEQYPILFSHKELVVQSRTLHDNDAEITVILDPSQDAIPLTFLLVKEENQWKVWSMKVSTTYSPKVMALLKDTQTMQQIVADMLQDLQNNEVEQAYRDYTSREFRIKTPIEEFRSFLRAFAVLTDYESVEYNEPSISDVTGRISASLHNKNGVSIIEFTFGIEDEQWKIWGIDVQKQKLETGQELPKVFEETAGEQTVTSNPSQQSASMLFTKFEIGTGPDPQNIVMFPSRILINPHGPIFVFLYVHNGIAGTKVDVTLEHTQTDKRLPSVATVIQNTGESTVQIGFASPTQGWPKGIYRISVISSTGISQEFHFSVE